MTLQVVAVPRQRQEGWSECVQAPERAQMLPTCILLQIYLYSERLRIAMATPVTNWRIRAKTHKGSHFEGFSLFLSVFPIFPHHRNRFWADGPIAALPWTLCILQALCFPSLVMLRKRSCYWSQWEYQVFVFHLLRLRTGPLLWHCPVQRLFSVP